MKFIYVIFFISLSCFAQHKLKTEKYAGTYSYKIKGVEAAGGEIIIYPETDSTVLYYIEINRGAPSYNSGAIYGRLTITEDKAVAKECTLEFKFSENSITVNSSRTEIPCDYFGGNVIADGTYNRAEKNIPEFFIDREGSKIRFREITPEQYYDN